MFNVILKLLGIVVFVYAVIGVVAYTRQEHYGVGRCRTTYSEIITAQSVGTAVCFDK